MAQTTPDENKAFVQRFFDQVVNQRNVSALPDFTAVADGGGTCGGTRFADLVSDPALRGGGFAPAAAGGGRGGDVDVQAWQAFTEHVLQAFPDLNVHIDSLVAEGDTVVVRWSARPTHQGEFLSTPATGRKVHLQSTDFFTFKDGKIASVSSHPDTARVLHALGHLPQTPLVTALVKPAAE
ncbi:MAG TPA: ester cyclase [Jatrophihabitans sp.]|nr:ester cyclase [Jatrophihabitans sp.]